MAQFANSGKSRADAVSRHRVLHRVAGVAVGAAALASRASGVHAGPVDSVAMKGHPGYVGQEFIPTRDPTVRRKTPS